MTGVKPLFFVYRIPATSMRGHGASLLKTLLRHFFHLLYHQFAFTYDLVAATVSLNRWKDWGMSVIPFIAGTRILEIGHGPGHLQCAFLNQGLVAVGVDESPQMGHLAKRNLARGSLSQVHTATTQNTHPPQPAYARANLTRGLAQHLPFPNEVFDTVVATFPAEYIFDPETLREAQRVLVPSGRFVILPGALLTGRGIWDRLMAWVFRLTGQTPPNLSEIIHERSKEHFAEAGFQVETHEITVKSSLVFMILAIKIKL